MQQNQAGSGNQAGPAPQEQAAVGYPPIAYDVRITSLNLTGGSQKASATVNLNGAFAVRGIKVMEGSKGLFVSMPSYKSGNEYKDICFPCTKEERPRFDKAVMDAYQQAIQQVQTNGAQAPQQGQAAAPAQQQAAPAMRM